MGSGDGPIMKYYYVLGINPEPWAMGTAFAIRGRRAAGVSPNRKLVAFQQAAREALLADYDPPLLTEPLRMRFWFKRVIEKTTYGEKSAHANYSDATNLQKGLEDAFQGILYKNDRQVVDIHSVIVEQGPEASPVIVIEVDDDPDIQSERKLMLEIIANQAHVLAPRDDNKW